MATQSDVRRIAIALPGTTEANGRFAFEVARPGEAKPRGYAWVWLERIHPKQARVPNPSVLALRVSDLGTKDLMISAEPEKFFTEPHYNGYPAVLLRLGAVKVAELRVLLTEAWRCTSAPKPKRSSSRTSARRP